MSLKGALRYVVAPLPLVMAMMCIVAGMQSCCVGGLALSVGFWVDYTNGLVLRFSYSFLTPRSIGLRLSARNAVQARPASGLLHAINMIMRGISSGWARSLRCLLESGSTIY